MYKRVFKTIYPIKEISIKCKYDIIMLHMLKKEKNVDSLIDFMKIDNSIKNVYHSGKLGMDTYDYRKSLTTSLSKDIFSNKHFTGYNYTFHLNDVKSYKLDYNLLCSCKDNTGNHWYSCMSTYFRHEQEVILQPNLTFEKIMDFEYIVTPMYNQLDKLNNKSS
jgi:hypothetical protein